MRCKYKIGLSILSLVLILVLAYIIISYAALFFAGNPVFMPSTASIEASFKQNRSDLLAVSEYVKSLEYDTVYITKDGVVSVADYESGQRGERIEISDQDVVAAVERLFQKSNFHVISSIPNEFIEFQKWSARDIGCGIAYSFDEDKPAIEFVTELIPLSESGWYYYVSDFNTYR